MGSVGVTGSHPEQVFITVVLLVPSPDVVLTGGWARGERGRAGHSALPLPVRLVQEAHQVLVTLLLRGKGGTNDNPSITIHQQLFLDWLS